MTAIFLPLYFSWFIRISQTVTGLSGCGAGWANPTARSTIPKTTALKISIVFATWKSVLRCGLFGTEPYHLHSLDVLLELSTCQHEWIFGEINSESLKFDLRTGFACYLHV